jgi:putative tryptophan/tyrosine transport system substrate-binding protein
MQEVAKRMSISLFGPPLDEPLQRAEYRRVFAAMAKERVEALIVMNQEENSNNQRVIVELAKKGHLPTIFPFAQSAELGGLMAYTLDYLELGRRAANEVAAILKGTKPGEISYYQPTKFELIINLKTAQALGLTIPPSLLARADAVIE